jgi:predicted DNA-binding transcriptional regulator AlpA
MSVILKRSFSEQEASQYIGLSRSFLRQARMNGALKGSIPPPKFIRLGSRTIRYLKEDLDAWLEQFIGKQNV